jgi:phosphoribosylformylglycinamidine synthase subunit PurS
MKAKIYVTLKPSVLDPQGKAIQHSVELLGYKNVADIRQGKFFEVTLDSTITDSEAQIMIENIAKDVLANSVIEDFRVEIEK